MATCMCTAGVSRYKKLASRPESRSVTGARLWSMDLRVADWPAAWPTRSHLALAEATAIGGRRATSPPVHPPGRQTGVQRLEARSLRPRRRWLWVALAVVVVAGVGVGAYALGHSGGANPADSPATPGAG